MTIEIKDSPPIILRLESGKVICEMHNKPTVELNDISAKQFKNIYMSIKRSGVDDTEEMVLNRLSLLDNLAKEGVIKNENENRYKNLENYYIEKINKHREIFSDLSRTLSIVSKIDANEQFKNIYWMNVIYGGEIKKDPIIFAVENGWERQIDCVFLGQLLKA